MLCINFRIQKTDRKIPERERLRWNLGNNFSAAGIQRLHHLIINFLIIPLAFLLTADIIRAVWLQIRPLHGNIRVGNHCIKASHMVRMGMGGQHKIERYLSIPIRGMILQIL